MICIDCNSPDGLDVEGDVINVSLYGREEFTLCQHCAEARQDYQEQMETEGYLRYAI